MRIRLHRKYLASDYTIGDWFMDGILLFQTIEDKVRDTNADGDLDDEGEEKVFGETAIPYGRYNMDLTMSPKFKRMYLTLLE